MVRKQNGEELFIKTNNTLFIVFFFFLARISQISRIGFFSFEIRVSEFQRDSIPSERGEEQRARM